MALSSPIRISLIVSFFGILAFVLGVIAENKKVRPGSCYEPCIKDDELRRNTTHYRYCGFPLNILVMLPLLQPAAGTPIQGKDVVICKFPSDPTIAMGSLSLVALVVAAIVGHVAIFFPYSGKSVPRGALFQSTSLTVFFVVAE